MQIPLIISGALPHSTLLYNIILYCAGGGVVVVVVVMVMHDIIPVS